MRTRASNACALTVQHAGAGGDSGQRAAREEGRIAASASSANESEGAGHANCRLKALRPNSPSGFLSKKNFSSKKEEEECVAAVGE